MLTQKIYVFMVMMRKISFPLQVTVGIVAGVLCAIVCILLQINTTFILTYIKPVGEIFINSLKAFSIPIVITGIVQGISSLEDTKKFSSISFKIVLLYTLTTLLSVCLGMGLASVVQPGKKFSQVLKEKFVLQYAGLGKQQGFYDRFGREAPITPDNLFKALTDNANLLFIVIFAILFALALMNIQTKKRKVVIEFFDAINQVFREIIKLVMQFAPLGVFALSCSVLIEQAQGQDLRSIYEFIIGISWYTALVLAGLGFMIFIVYPLLVTTLTEVSWKQFIQAVYKAQVVAFTTSSSTAALPISIACAENNLGVSKKISNFVLSLGASINMDGTVLYQGIAISFIAQAYGVELPIEKILTIILYLTISSLGIGGIPSMSLGTTSIILHTLGIPASAIALILIPERLLDMGRSSTNITGDLCVTLLVDRLEKGKSKKSLNE